VELGAIAVPFGNGAGAGTVDGAILGAGNHQNRAGNGRDIDSRRPVIVEHPEEHLEHHPARFRTQAVEDPVLRLDVALRSPTGHVTLGRAQRSPGDGKVNRKERCLL
jgi:hypothetical protein